MSAPTAPSPKPAPAITQYAQIGRCNLACALALLLGAAALALPSAVAVAQSSSTSYQIPRQSTDAGAGQANSASYQLNGSIGQPDAGPAMSSVSYTLRSGFQRAAPIALTDEIFSDGFEN